jgi:transposase-like protein
MPRRIRFSCDELSSRYADGQSTISLARLYGCSPTTIAKHLRACGVTLRRSRFVPVQVEEAALRQAYLDERLPIMAIARHFGVSASTIGNKRRRYGIPLRSRHGATPALSEPV